MCDKALKFLSEQEAEKGNDYRRMYPYSTVLHYMKLYQEFCEKDKIIENNFLEIRDNQNKGDGGFYF